MIALHEVDADGKLRAVIRFDADDRVAAFEEAERRFLAGEAVAIGGQAPIIALSSAINRRHWEAMQRLLTEAFINRDHRTLGVGAQTGEELVASLRALADLSPDFESHVIRLLAWNHYGRVAIMRQVGSALQGGGPFENYFIAAMLARGDRIDHQEVFDIDAADAALARFDELCAERDPLRIPLNAASRAREVADDTAALRAIVSDDFVWEDRGKRTLLRGGVDQYIQSMEFIRSRGGRASREWIGTRGDRIAIERVVLTGIGDSGEFEIELIGLAEVDASGKLRAGMRFDPEDRGAAFEEAERRFLAGEAAAIGGQAPFAAFGSAYRRRDWEAMRRCFANDAVVCDHRLLGVGAETPDQFVASARAQAELSPDAVAEGFRLLAWNRHGRVAVIRAVGSALHGGGPFERVDITVFLTDGDRIQRLEPFDIDAADAALARFAELCAERESRE